MIHIDTQPDYHYLLHVYSRADASDFGLDFCVLKLNSDSEYVSLQHWFQDILHIDWEPQSFDFSVWTKIQVVHQPSSCIYWCGVHSA